jgi:hypothetical protein
MPRLKNIVNNCLSVIFTNSYAAIYFLKKPLAWRLLYRVFKLQGVQKACFRDPRELKPPKENHMIKKAKQVMIVTGIAIFGFATLALAGWGNGYGYGMGMDRRGSNWHHRGGNDYCMSGNYGNLTEAERATVDQQRSEFFNAAEGIRGQLYEKDLALQAELAKENPDMTIASNLQSEISELQAELDQKRLDFHIHNRKTGPGFKSGFGGHGPMMGYGPRGNTYCRW